MKRLIVWALALVGLISAVWLLFSLSNRNAQVASREDVSEENFEYEEGEKVPSSYFFDQRAYPFGKIDHDAYRVSRLMAAEMRNELPAQAGAVWTQRGPLNVQGRVTAMAVDPTNDNIAYAAAAEGGVFRTMDGGNSWTALFDDMPTIAVGAITLDPSDPNTIYAGTGEVNPGGGSMAYGGTGLYKSTDQGNTWTYVGLPDSGSIGRIVVNPNDPDIIHVAVMGHLWTSGTDRGVYRTDNGGATWTKVLYINDTTGCVDLIQRPDNPNVLFAAMWQRIRQPEYYDYGGIGCGVYQSTDGGSNWSLVGNGLPAPSSNTGRIGLAICNSTPDVMCVIYADRTGFFDGLFRTTNGGAFWTQTNDGSLSNVFASYGWWFGNVRIHPQDPDTIFAVGFNVYRSTNGGNSYSQVGGNMHVDHHGFAFGSGASPKMYDGNDGGVYTSTNGSTWTKTTGDLPITQAYRIATAPWDTDALWLGTQDNGTNMDLDGDGDYVHIYGGDGFQPVPHLTNPNRMWAQYQYGNVAYSSNGGNSFSNAKNGLSGRFNWNAPHAQDPSDPETRYFGTQRVYRNNGNTSWSSISGDLTGGSHLGNSGQVNGTLTTIAVSPADSDVIWSGSDDGYVHVTQNGGSNWSDVSAGLPVRWITSIFPHPTDAAAALVTVSGFRWGEDMAHIYRTNNYGASWTPVDGNLPDVPVNDVFVDPMHLSRYFAATDVGVFESADGGTTWQAFGIGLPNVVVNDFAYQSATRELFAGTYGRSIFSISIDDFDGTPVAADSVNVVLGTNTEGDLSDADYSDDTYLKFLRGNAFSPFSPAIWLEFEGTLPTDDPSLLKVVLECSVNDIGITQKIEMFNYDTGQFELVDSLGSTLNVDSVAEIELTGDLTRYVEAGTGAVKTKVTYTADGTGFFLAWTACIDQFVWKSD